MGIFGPSFYKTKKKDKYWLHVKEKGKIRLFYFSKDPVGAVDIPKNYGVIENEKTGLPFLKKKVPKKSEKAPQASAKK